MPKNFFPAGNRVSSINKTFRIEITSYYYSKLSEIHINRPRETRFKPVPHTNNIKSAGMRSACTIAVVNLNNLPNDMKTMGINKKRRNKKITEYTFSRMP